MAYLTKIALLLLNDDQTKFLVCEKENLPSDFIMPGGQIEEGESDGECLQREIGEELSCEWDEPSIELVGEYEDFASGDPTKDITIL